MSTASSNGILLDVVDDKVVHIPSVPAHLDPKADDNACNKSPPAL